MPSRQSRRAKNFRPVRSLARFRAGWDGRFARFRFRFGERFTFTLLTVKILAVAAAPAHALTVGLVKLAVIASVIPFKKAFLYALHRKVKTESSPLTVI